MSTSPVGVLLMAYGGPDSLEDLPGYLADIRRGRTTSRGVIDEIARSYRSIGGRSPLLDMTMRQASALARRLDPGRFACYVGMRHWAPWIEDAVARMAEDGVTRGVSLVLAPQYSAMSVGAYHGRISKAMEMIHAEIEFSHVTSYHDAAGYIRAFAARVNDSLQQWSGADGESVHVMFSAHSLPVRILAAGDPYDAQCRDSARRIAERTGIPGRNWSWCYQSAGRSAEPWLGPSMEDHLQMLAREGVRRVLSVPLGFVSDHVEVLFDIDIRAREYARQLGVHLERVPMLNDDPVFIDALADIVEARAAAWSAASPS